MSQVSLALNGHVPVLAEEVIAAFDSLVGKNNLSYFDGTFGRGGHYTLLKNKYNITRAVATDQDLQAIAYAKENYPEVTIHHINFHNFSETNTEKFDMMLADLGVSSPQLDQADRGFSFNKDGPLDMRMNQNQSMTAARIINEFTEDDLFKLFREYGEIQNPARAIRAIVEDRKTKPFETTLQLAGLIERVDGWHKKGFHPATQYFMALRLVVNQELYVVEEGVKNLMQQLNDGGRLAVISFHSLEDRIIKNLFKDSDLGFSVNKKVIVPSEEECKTNPRARSAKLRIFQKGAQPEKPDKFALRRMQREQNDN
ncbi:16S rRNA (cytosine(1402)-N(4))-methyltransferase RsmH [Pseudobdellovibrio sp. HCB154]|uniref:16S rRNA (cytosine(1402)-N(4))-methyltransferase RsmH n=1 Tax=Pseudobdellovibrio sp. HCB154 TaxID=3386277 RepID=UPI003917407F